jgi:hypothetical protein
MTLTPTGALQSLLDQAERDIDRVIQKTLDLTDLIQGISMTGVTGGEFGVSLGWGIASYTVNDVPHDVDGNDFLNYLNAMEDPHGNLIPSGSWIEPSGTFNSQYYAFGPLPNTPIVFEAIGNLGAQRLPLVSIDTTGLTGPNPQVTVAQMVGGGLKMDPNQLSGSDAMALKRATCAQAEYRDQMGAAFFTTPQYKTVSGPEFNVSGRRPRIGPRVMDELADTDLIQRGARATITTNARRQFAFQPIGALGIPDDWRAI